VKKNSSMRDYSKVESFKDDLKVNGKYLKRNSKKCTASSARVTSKRVPSGLVSGALKGNGKLIFPHGNYSKYYSSRRKATSKDALRQSPITGLERDVRLRAVQEALGSLKGEVMLDIGCNEGIVPIELAGLYNAHWCEGVDLDLSLIKTANKTLREIRYQVMDVLDSLMLNERQDDDVLDIEQEPSMDFNATKWECLLEPLSEVLPPLNGLISNILKSSDNPEDQIKGSPENMDYNCFPFNVRFLPENLAIDGSRERSLNQHQDTKEQEQGLINDEYDLPICQSIPDLRFSIITMFSVVKWIHIAYGDAVLKRLFRRVFNLLCNGGYFILEPQNWHSYRNARRQRKSSNGCGDLRLEFKPHQFDNYLVTKIGFERFAFILPYDQNVNKDHNSSNCRNVNNNEYRIVRVGDVIEKTMTTSSSAQHPSCSADQKRDDINNNSYEETTNKIRLTVNGQQDSIIDDGGVKEGPTKREQFKRTILIYRKS